MNVYYAGDFQTFPSLDLLEVIAQSLGFRVKLDDVAQATLGYGKSGHGLQAVEWWKQGDQKIKDYCLQDVKVTKEVYEFGKNMELFGITTAWASFMKCRWIFKKN